LGCSGGNKDFLSKTTPSKLISGQNIARTSLFAIWQKVLFFVEASLPHN
jgi:hypothetical protein